MKKILLFILLLFIGFSYGYSQYVPIQIVTEYDDPFLRHLPLNQMVYCKDSDAVYMLDIPAFPISKLSTTANHRVIGFTLDTTGFVMWTDTLVLIATKYDLDTLSNSIYDSLDTHNGLIQTWLQDTANLVHWSDTLTDIATKYDVDTLSNSVYDSLGNHYALIHKLDTGKVSTSGDNMYGTLNIKNGNFVVKGTVDIGNVPLGTDIDSVLIMENGQLKNVDGSSFKPDSTSAGCFNNFYYKQITGCDNNNLYIKAYTTSFSNDIKLPKFTNSNTEPVLKVLPSGRIDTNSTISIMGTYLDSLDVGEIDVTTLNSFTSNITNANITTSIEQNLVLPNLGSNYEPVLSVADLSGNIDTTQVMIITETTLDSLKIDKYVVIGGVKTEDIKFTLSDDGVYSFAETSYGLANLYSYNAGKMTSFVRYTFDSDGTIYMEASTPLVNGADADGYEICLYYIAGSYYIKNTSGGSRTYLLTQKK